MLCQSGFWDLANESTPETAAKYKEQTELPLPTGEKTMKTHLPPQLWGSIRVSIFVLSQPMPTRVNHGTNIRQPIMWLGNSWSSLAPKWLNMDPIGYPLDSHWIVPQ